jgi:hypothetical protein
MMHNRDAILCEIVLKIIDNSIMEMLLHHQPLQSRRKAIRGLFLTVKLGYRG